MKFKCSICNQTKNKKWFAPDNQSHKRPVVCKVCTRVIKDREKSGCCEKYLIHARWIGDDVFVCGKCLTWQGLDEGGNEAQVKRQ